MPMGIGLGIGVTRGGGVGVDSILAAFADGTDGLYFDFSKTDQLFQTVNGGAAADGAGENIALALEGHAWAARTYAQQMAQQAELVANGTFDSNTTGWSQAGPGSFAWDPSGAIACSDVAGGDCNAQTPFTSVVGRRYRFAWKVRASNGGYLTRIRNSTDYQSAFTVAITGDFEAVFAASTTTNTVNLLAADTNTTTVFDDISVKEIVGSHGSQATTAAQPKYQTGDVARFDGSDDNLLTTKIAAATGYIMARSMPTSGAALQVLVGAVGASGTDRIYLGVDASNQAVCRIGNGAALAGAVSIAGVDGTIGVRWNGTTVDLLVNGVVVATQAQVGLPTTTRPLRVGAYNSNGTAANFFTGDVWDVIEADKALTDAAALSIHNQLMAA